MKELLLITPPFTQLNTPYPATVYLKGFLNTKGIASFQMDLGIEVILALFSRSGLIQAFDFAQESGNISSENAQQIYSQKNDYLNTIDKVIGFLQGENQEVAEKILSNNFLPRASRFSSIDDNDWLLDSMEDLDKAKYLATLYIEDLSDFMVECIDDNFGFSRYAEHLGKSANAFDELYDQLQQVPTYVDGISLKILEERIQETQPKLICFSAPFPGNLYSAFRCAQFIKRNHANIVICMGGGFPNTELRSVSDIRVFDFFDFITLDDGELPLELIANYVLHPGGDRKFKRTFCVEGEEVVYNNSATQQDCKQSEIGTPDYTDLLLDKYISVIEIANPMHSLWSDGRWNKLTMAHGCYWRKCTFCDTSLDYIKNYEPLSAKLLVNRMEEMIAKTGENGFHFVDEAAPPALMRELAIEILKRNIHVTWWTNIRFEKSFTYDLCQLLKSSGCIAVSGGLEVASDRLLALIDKGVSVEQVAQVTNSFTQVDIMVHAYLIYGFPSQTIQETIDSLEMVRQLFEMGTIQSGFWHQFSLTTHSPIAKDPSNYGVVSERSEISFADNDLDFVDETGIDHTLFSDGLKKSLYNYMHDVGFEFPLQDWFDFEIPQTSVDQDTIESFLDKPENFVVKPASRVLWLGGKPQVVESKKGAKDKLVFQDNEEEFQISIQKEKVAWILSSFDKITVHQQAQTLADLKTDYESQFQDFDLFWYSKPINKLREHGLVVL